MYEQLEKEYGGFFCEEIARKGYQEDTENMFYFDSARSGIRYLIRNTEWEYKTVFLPEYLCESMLIPFEESGWNIVFYPIHEDFSVDWATLDSLIQEKEPGLLYVLSYFGFDTLSEGWQKIKEYQNKGIRILEDVTHSYYNQKEVILPDYRVGSLRKWCGLLDGGFLWICNSKESQRLHEYKVDLENTFFLNLKHESFKKKRNILQGIGRDFSFIEDYENSEEILDAQSEIYTMSELSRQMLWTLDTEEIKKIRRNNYHMIARELEMVNGIRFTGVERYEMSVPLYFPFYVENGKRDVLRQKAREKNVFLPIIWPLAEQLTKKVNPQIYRKILCVPCDQRWNTEDIRYMCKVIKTIIK